MPITDYHRQILAARQLPLEITESVESEILAALHLAKTQIQAILDDSTLRTGKLPAAQFARRQAEIERHLSTASTGIVRLIREGVNDVSRGVANIREDATNDLLGEAEARSAVSFGQVPLDILTDFARRTDAEGLLLSPNIWAENQRKAIARVVSAGIARGQSSDELGILVESFLTGDPIDDKRIIDARKNAKAGMNVNAKAKRLARSEIVNAAWETNRQSAVLSPIVHAQKWNLSARHRVWDSCDIFAGQDLYGLGKGVYPPEKLPPKPHPNDMCFLTDELRDVTAWNTEKPPPPDLQIDVQSLHIIGKGTEGHINRESERFKALIAATE